MKNFLVILAVVCSIHFNISGADAGLKLHLPLNETSGIVAVDYSGHANNGTISNTTLLGKGQDFNGINSYVRVPDHNSIQNLWTGGGTISACIKPRSAGENSVGGIANKYIGHTKGWYFLTRESSGGKVKLQFRVLRSISDGEWTTIVPEVSIGAWSHVAITYNGDSITNNAIFYVNGVSVPLTRGLAPNGTVNDDTGVDQYVGTQGNINNTFDGVIREAILNDEILSSDQINLLHQDCTRANMDIVNQFYTGSSICLGQCR